MTVSSSSSPQECHIAAETSVNRLPGASVCPKAVVSPAHDGLVGSQCAGVMRTSGYGGKPDFGNVQLASVVVAPALDEAVGSQCARMSATCGHRGVFTVGCVGLPVVVAAPTSDGVVGLQPAGVKAPG